MKIFTTLFMFCYLWLLNCTPTMAAMQRNPIGVNVSASSAVSVSVRFADNNGGLFTTTEALFCFKQLSNGQCDPSAILGRLPVNRDLGSTRTPASSITDVMTIPYSVIRSAVVRAQSVDFSDFYYIRRFTPVGNADLGAGPGRDVYVKVTCHLAGPATIPLSLTQVAIHGIEQNSDAPVRVIRLNDSNIDAGFVEARVEHTGTGILEGWWEVRRPGDPQLQEIDNLPEAALSEADRKLRQRFTRLKRFRVEGTTVGSVVIPGPTYSDLPQDVSGLYEILLRFDATRGRENRARLNVPGESTNLFSGGLAAFRIPVLEYIAPSNLESTALLGSLGARLISGTNENGRQVWRLTWSPQMIEGLVLEFKVNIGNSVHKIIAPVMKGYLDFPNDWVNRLPQNSMSVTLIGPDGIEVNKAENVRY